MKKLSIVLASVLALVGMASCNKDVQQPEEALLTLTVEASKEGTRGLTVDGNKLNAIWTSSDKVYVYKDNYAASNKVGELTPASTGSASTNLVGTVKAGSVSAGTKLVFVTPRSAWSYVGQDGTLAKLATDYNYSTAEATVSSVSGTDVKASTATFKASQAVVRFKLQDSKTSAAVKVTQFDITASSGKLVNGANIKTNGEMKTTYGTLSIKPKTASDELYVAVWNESGAADTYDITAYAGNAIYHCTATGADLKQGHFYGITTKLVEDNSTYTVTGAPASIFGVEWDQTATANDMTRRSDGIFEKTYDVKAITNVAFKIVKNHAWAHEGGGEWPVTDYTIKAGVGKLTITFNPVTEEVKAEAADPGNVTEVYTVAGNDAGVFGTEWDPTNTANDMTLQGDGTYAITYNNIAEGTHLEFKIVVDHSWTLNYGVGGKGGSNVIHDMSATKNLTIKFNPKTFDITATEN